MLANTLRLRGSRILMNRSRVMFSSEGGGPPSSKEMMMMRKEQEKNRIEQDQREKLKKAPELDSAEDVSFQGKHMYLKMIFYTMLFCGISFKGHYMMQEKLARRQARLDGRLLEYEQQKYDLRAASWKGKLMGVRPEEAPIKNQIGGQWQLQDLDERDFGSRNLEGHYYLLYFGGTLCPDVCPITLMKMQKAQRILNRTASGKQYIQFQTIFVSTNPEYDTVKRLKSFRDEMFTPSLICLRTDKNTSPELLLILKQFRVPVGLSDQETEQFKEFFQTEKKSLFERIFGRRADDDGWNDHSKCMYLMAPDNQFLNFYSLELTEEELSRQITEDISYDIGIRHIGTGNYPDKLNE